MRVRADEATQAYWNYGVVKIAKDEIVDGGLAQYLAETGAPVTVLDDEPVAGADIRTPDAVPDGSAEKVLEWVGDNPEKALRALESETAGKARKGLMAALEKLLEAAAADGADSGDGSADQGADGGNNDTGAAATGDGQQPPAE